MSSELFSSVPVVVAQNASIQPWVLGLCIAVLLLIPLYIWRYQVFIRLPLWIVSRLFYRITAHGLENIPDSGPALLVANHVSHIDAPLIMARVRRPIRFLIWAEFLNMFWLKPLLRTVRVIPVKNTGGPRAIIESLRLASEALANGELVCIFAEGGITRTGFLLPFQRGLEQILKRQPAPIIPVCLDHVWGSVFSFRGGKFFWKFPKQWPYPVTVMYGKPLPTDTPAPKVRQAIELLSAESAVSRAADRTPVHRQFVRTACKQPFRPCFIDPMNKDAPVMKYGEALARAKILTRHLERHVHDEEMVGVWLPPSPGGAITNIALSFLGKTAVNLNYSVSMEVVQSAVQQCKLRKVLTSRLFTRKVPLDAGPDVEIVYLDDFRKEVTKWEQIRSYLSVLLTPRYFQEHWLLKLGGHSCEDLATIIFSSGSTGEPKGVMLTHGNIAANCESIVQAIDPTNKDRLLSILPFFHSFGYTVTLWVPPQVGAATIFYPNPLAAKEIGDACRDFEATLFIATPTFLRSYIKRCGPDDFKSLRLLVCGAEKMSPLLAEAFEKKFGVSPLEGFGCTEAAPVVATNVPGWEGGGWQQVGYKFGTVGQPIPGVAAKIVDPDTMAEKGEDEEGMLLVYGANVMKGYLNRPDLTAQKMHEGWYITGDLGKIDEDGFITITGRLERFAKVAGEMVPLEKVEEEIHQVMDTDERVFAVTAIPDEKRGERLVVLHLPLNGTDTEQLRQGLSSRGLPNIYIPSGRDFFEVDELPVLGVKLDLKKCKQKALELTGS